MDTKKPEELRKSVMCDSIHCGKFAMHGRNYCAGCLGVWKSANSEFERMVHKKTRDEWYGVK